MLLNIRKWFQKNGFYLKLALFLFLGSLITGFTILGLSLFLPGFFSTITSIASLSFLAMMNFPLALLTLTAITVSITFLTVIAALLFTKQLLTIGSHIGSLLFNQNNELVISRDSTHYMHTHLKKERVSVYEYSEEDNDLWDMSLSAESADFADAPDSPILLDETDEKNEHGEHKKITLNTM
jgi:hypothetical protein